MIGSYVSTHTIWSSTDCVGQIDEFESGERGAPESGKPESGKPESGKPESGKPESGKPERGKISVSRLSSAMYRENKVPIRLDRRVASRRVAKLAFQGYLRPWTGKIRCQSARRAKCG